MILSHSMRVTECVWRRREWETDDEVVEIDFHFE